MIKSPCINLCKIDSKTKVCLGCKRNIKEISNWINMNDKKKKKFTFKFKK